MLMALKDEEPPLKMEQGMDPFLMKHVQEQMDKRVQKQLDYAKLTPQQKLDLAYKQYR